MKDWVCLQSGENVVTTHSTLYSHLNMLIVVTAPQKDNPNSLFYLAMVYHGRSFASAILPRLCATGFNFCQPFLIKRVINYLSQPDGHDNTKQIGRALIGAFCIVYVGFSVSRLLFDTYCGLC